MNLENFKEVYLKTISESTDDSDLENWIRSIVEEILNEEKYDLTNDLTKDAKKLLDIFDKDPIEFQEVIMNYPEWNKWISEITIEDNLHPDDDFVQIQDLAIAKLDKLWKKNN
jgi:hypothetical protein